MNLLRMIYTGVISTLLMVSAVEATPMYYTFEGTATGVTDITGASGVAVGDTLTYVYLVDFETGGTVTNLDASVSSIEDAFSLYEPSIVYDTSTMDNFYVDYLSGNAYFGATGVANNFLELNTGVNYYGPGRYTITGGDAIGVAGFQEPVQSWAISDVFFSLNVWGNQSERITGSVTLVDISNVSSVPEPASIALMAIGLAGLGFAGRKKQRK